MSDPPTAVPPGRLRAWLGRGRTRFWIAGVVLLSLGIRAALPWGLARTIESQAGKWLGRVVRVGDVDLALVAGRAAVEDLLVGPPLEHLSEGDPVDPERALLRWSRLDVDLSWLALLRGEVALRAVELEAPRVRVIRGEDGRLVPLRAVPPASEEAEEPDPGDAGGGWPVTLDRLRVRDVDLLLVNLARPHPPIALTFDELSVADLAFRDGEVDVGPVGLQTARVRMQRDVDLQGFAAGEETDALGEEEARTLAAEQIPEQPPPRYRIEEVAIEASSFTLIVDDVEIEASLRFAAHGITGDQDQPFPIELDLGLEDGSVALRGEVGVTPVRFDGTLQWSGLPLPALLSGAVPAAPLHLASGASAGELELDVLLAQVEEQGASRITARGRVEVTALDAELDEPQATVAWEALEIEIAEASLAPPGRPGAAPPHIELAALRLRAPRVGVTRSAPAATAGPEETPAEAAEPDAPATGSEPGPELRLALLELDGGSADVRDETLLPPHHTHIEGLEARGRDLRWPEADAAELVVSGRTAGQGSFSMNAGRRDGDGRIDLDLKEIVLPPFSAYAADAAGYRIEAGRLSLEAGVDFSAGGTRIDSDLVFHHLDVAEVEPGSFGRDFGMPIDLALALLRDPRGRISLPVVASLSPGRSDVALTGILVAALRQAIVGALASPLKAAGLLLGSGEEDGGLDLEALVLEPGQRDAGDAGDAQLAGFSTMLENRPGLGLVLRGRAGPADDRALAEEMLIEAVREDAELPPVSAGLLQRRRLRGALEQRGRGEAGALDAEDAAVLEGWIGSVRVPEDRRRRLAGARAEAARARLAAQHGAEPDRVALGEPLDGEPGVVIELAPLRR